ncbi:MAG: hypothetical protein P4M02_03825 [Clostridia bacterium]|nr:hypothetical protein [Clostridia bacterium]
MQGLIPHREGAGEGCNEKQARALCAAGFQNRFLKTGAIPHNRLNSCISIIFTPDGFNMQKQPAFTFMHWRAKAFRHKHKAET